jgi:hypothetical protein
VVSVEGWKKLNVDVAVDKRKVPSPAVPVAMQQTMPTYLNHQDVSIHALERSRKFYKVPRTLGAVEGTLQGA